MSTMRVSSIKNASSATGGLDIAADGSVTGALPSPNRNLLYNGAMQVAQRGTSVTGITSGGYRTADRFLFLNDALGTWTQDLQNDAPTGSGFRRSFRVLCTTADTAPAGGDLLAVDQRLEGQDLQRILKGTSSARPLTLSFWVKSNVTGTYVVNLRDIDNARTVSATYTISASATWEKKTITFPADTTGALDNDNDLSLVVRWGLGAGSNFTSGSLATTWSSYSDAIVFPGQTNLAAATNNYWQITGVQLEVGDTATEFEFKSYGQELRECQRYFYQWVTGSTFFLGIGANYDASTLYAYCKFPVSMRVTPNLSAASGTNFYQFNRNGGNDTFNSFTIFNANTEQAGVQNTTEISGTAGHGGGVFTINAASSVAFNAEL